MIEPTNNKKIQHIAVAGNIGAGKTTLVELLSKSFNWEIMYEDVENNPYLQDFYENMPRWSFNLQIYFLNSRFNQIRKIRQATRPVIQDRTIYEDANIFAPNLHEMGLMTQRDFSTYLTLYDTLLSQYEHPDLMIYLRASVPKLVEQIRTRGRDYEENIRIDYLGRLNDYYERWIEQYSHSPKLIVNIDECNFKDNPEQLGEVINRVHSQLYGLF
ncbi:MAG: deoxynucleoside kinase [Sphingobacteriales bacterium]|jgi:deoxyadenosine/deoxycytidine kinase|nr:deoxynucleoside kinase [Sphingobacteriales bacterium]MBP9140086.1 deoxynucleoside kinase [Chitinophagales bacterium]MDA0197831.1 deoxynucleoside kinase [Bacteroidota bacterium]MBK6889947.1 deoxynucleoside kinase [Sphingobacteriales bacterium]MBK7527529.1 deoxynucleoside kinase [Sphingobacteriales bacterium]